MTSLLCPLALALVHCFSPFSFGLAVLLAIGGGKMFGFSSSRSKGRFYPLFVALSLLLPFGVHADCDCCGLTNEIGQIVANAALSNCSSNCVRMTPEDCVNLRSNLLEYVDSIDSNASAVYSQLNTLIDLSNGLAEQVIALSNDTVSVISMLDGYQNYDLVYVALSSMETQIIAWTNRVGGIDLNANQMIYSNLYSHAQTILPRIYTISTKCSQLLGQIRNAKSNLSESNISNSTMLATAKYTLQSMLGNIGTFYSDLYDISMTASTIQPYFQSIQDDSVQLRSLTQSMACESCGSGSGTNNTVNGTIDITPIVNAIHDLQDRLEYWMERLYDLLYKYFDDYRYAAFHAPSGTPSLSGYNNLPANWFSRVEYLLYAISDIANSDSSSDAPSSPVGGDALDSFVSDSSSSKSQQDDALADLNSSSFARLRTSLLNFIHVYESWGLTQTDISGSLVMTFPSLDSGESGYYLTVPSGFSTAFSVIQKAFKFLWWVALACLYFYFCKLALSLMCLYAKWFLTICSAVFG